MVRSEVLTEVPSVGPGAEAVSGAMFPDEQGLCVQPVSVGSCTPLIEEGKHKPVMLAGTNTSCGKFCDPEAGTPEDKVTVTDGFLRMAVPVCSGRKRLLSVLSSWCIC